MTGERRIAWANYATEAQALNAMNTQRFGIARWDVEYDPSREPEPWVLIEIRREETEWPSR